MKTILPSVAAAVLCLAAAHARGASFEQGMKLMQAGRYAQAIAELEKVSRVNPGSIEVLTNLGWAYWKARRLDKARETWRILSRLDPANATYARVLAELELEDGNGSRALELAGKALRLSPGDRDAELVRAKALMSLGRDREALEALEALVRLHPDHAASKFILAEQLVRLDRLQEALKLFDDLLGAEPSNPAYRRGRAGALYAMGKAEEAVAEWKRLAERDPPDTHALREIGNAYWEARRYGEAHRAWTRLVEIEPDNPSYLALLANAEMAQGDFQAAERLARRGLRLAPEDRGLTLALARALLQLHRDREAAPILERLVRNYRDDPKAKLFMADVLAQLGKLEEALGYFDQLAESDPSNTVYRKRRARLLFELGQFEEAVTLWTQLASQQPSDPEALQRLMEDAFIRGAWEESLEWARRLAGVRPLDSYLWQMLSRLLLETGRYPQALKAAESWADVNPVSLDPVYFRAELFETIQDWSRAQEAYLQVLSKNPSSHRALWGLARAAEGQGKRRRAISLLRKILKQSGAERRQEPFVSLYEARLLADSGRLQESLRVIRETIEGHDVSIPALVYQGISRHERGDSVPLKEFRAQMKAIKDRGYTAVSIAEIDRYFLGLGRLPEKPILITFDDARSDALAHADPVLKQLGLKATMFVHLAGQHRFPLHASLEELKRWRATGRWEIHSHGTRAHDLIPIDAEGRQGRFLANRMWLEGHRRLETPQEHRARVEKEMRESRDALQRAFAPMRVAAFAFPYGDDGGSDFTNAPEAVEANRALAAANFGYAFVQDGFGYNTNHTPYTRMRRLSVTREMTAERLARHLEDNDPYLRARLQEAGLWLRSNQPARALEIHDELEKKGYRSPEIMAQRGLALEKGGNSIEARELFARASSIQPEDERYRRLLWQSQLRTGPVLGSEIQGTSDNFEREWVKTLVRFQAPVRALRVGGWLGRGHYSEGSAPRIQVQETGLELRAFPGRGAQLQGSFSRRNFTQGGEGSQDNAALGGSLRVLPWLQLSGSAGLGSVETVSAIQRRRTYRSYGAGAELDPALGWTAAAEAQSNEYNDDNIGRQVRFGLSRIFARFFSLGYSFSHLSHAFSRMGEYYSPMRLNQHMGVLTMNMPLGSRSAATDLPRGELRAQYGLGYGNQDGLERNVHVFRGSLAWRIADFLTFQLGGQYSESPAYISRQATAGLGVNF